MKKTALFPGSFDPFTAGHLNILNRALTMFDEVVVAVGINQDKRGFFTMDQRMDIIRQAVRGLEGVRIIKYDSLTIDACRELGMSLDDIRTCVDAKVRQVKRDEGLEDEADTGSRIVTIRLGGKAQGKAV